MDLTGGTIYLLRCAVDGVAPDAGRVISMDLDSVCRMAQRHMVASACGMALKAANVVHFGFDEARGKAIRKVAAMDIEREALFARMDASGIWHVPLKGCALQGLYPAYGMREMSDNDILFDASRADDVRSIMESMGFETVRYDRVTHDVYHKNPVCNFELHRALFDESAEPRFYEYYRDVERMLVPDGDGSAGRHFGDEDFYVYLIAHEYKHYVSGGTGLRSLLDIYVFVREKGDSLDWPYVTGELDHLGLGEFERANRRLALRLFGGEELSVEDEEMLSYIVESGVYGNRGHGVQNGVRRYGRAGYLLRRAFLPYRQMLPLFPLLRRAPVLLPVCWLVRLGKALVDKRQVVFFQLKGAFATNKRNVQ